MKTKSRQIQNVEKKVNAVFYQRDAQYKAYGSSKRVPKQGHYATSIPKKSTSK